MAAADRKHIAILLASWSLLVWFFPLRIQPIEPYIYATAIEGMYDLKVTFAEANPNARLPDFSRFHPNHPLQHFVIGKLYDKTHWPALKIASAINFIFSLVALLFLFLTCKIVIPQNSIALMATACSAASTVFWLGTLSGEVHMPAFAMLSVAGWYLCRFLVAEKKREKLLLLSGFFFSLAATLHMGVFFAAIPAAAAVIADWRKAPQKRPHLLYYGAVVSMVLVMVALVYVALVVMVLELKSWPEYRDTMAIYAHIIPIPYSGFAWLLTITKTYLHSLVFGFGSAVLFGKILLALSLASGAVVFARSRHSLPIKLVFLLMLPFYFFSHFFFSIRPDALNGWLFVLPAFTVPMAYTIRIARAKLRFRSFGVAIFVLFFMANFMQIILPNSRTPAERYSYTTAFLSTTPTPSPFPRILVIAKDPVLTFADVYEMVQRTGRRTLEFIWSCCGRTHYRSLLIEKIQKGQIDWIISDDLASETPELLQNAGIKYEILFDQSGEISPHLLPASIYFERPPDYRVLKRIQIIRIVA